MKNIVSYILMVSLLLTFSSCKTGKDAPLASKSNSENNEFVKIKESSGIFTQKKVLALSRGGIDFHIKAAGICNDNYSSPAITNVNAAISGTVAGSATSSFSVGGVPFPAGITITISNVSGTIAGTPQIIIDETRHTKTITVDTYVLYTITATNGGKTAVVSHNRVIPLSATIEAKNSTEFFACMPSEKQSDKFKRQANSDIAETKTANDKSGLIINRYSIAQNFDVRQEYAGCLGEGYSPCSGGNMKHTLNITVAGTEKPVWNWSNGSMGGCTYNIRDDKNNQTYDCAARTELTVENIGGVYAKSINGKKYKAQDWLISVDTIMSSQDLTVIGHKITSKKITGLEEIK